MADAAKVTNGGLGIVTGLLAGAGATCAKNIAWGVGATGAAVTDTAMQTLTDCGESRVAGTPSQQQTTTSNDTFRVVGTMTCETTAKTITEVGLFTDASAGTLFMRATFSGIALSVGDSIAFTINNVFDN